LPTSLNIQQKVHTQYRRRYNSKVNAPTARYTTGSSYATMSFILPVLESAKRTKLSHEPRRMVRASLSNNARRPLKTSGGGFGAPNAKRNIKLPYDASCLCGRPQAFDQCCGPYLEGSKSIDTPVALMRARYVAYCLGEVDFIIRTTHPSHEDWRGGTKSSRREWARSLQLYAERYEYTKLEIVDTSTRDDGVHGEVEFKASFRRRDLADADVAHLHHERSHFVRSGMIAPWMYYRGEILDLEVQKGSLH